MEILKATNLSKIYQTGESAVYALNDVPLSLDEGSFTAITGPSGSGKSTLLHLLSGLDKPTHGSVHYRDKGLYKYNDNQLSVLRRRRFGFVFQSYNLVKELTGWENMLLPIMLDSKKPDEAYLGCLVEMLGISDRLSHLPGAMSGGQQQRFSIARALANKRGYLSLTIGVFLSIFLISTFVLGIYGIYNAQLWGRREMVGTVDMVVLDNEILNDDKIMELGAFDKLGHAYLTGSVADTSLCLGYYDTTGAELLALSPTAGRLPENPGEIAMEPSALEVLELEKAIGDTVEISIVPVDGTAENRTFTIVGFLPEKSEHLDMVDKLGLNQFPVIVTCEAEPAFATGRVGIHRVMDLQEGVSLSMALARFWERYMRPELVTAMYGLTVTTKQVQVYSAGEMFWADRELMDLISMAAVLAGALILSCSVGISGAMDGVLSKRREEIGVLRALGATRRQIRRMFGRENLILALLVSPVALIAGCIAVWVLSLMMPNLVRFGLKLWLILPIILFSIITILLSGYLPLVRASKLMPMIVIRDTQMLRRSKKVKSKTVFSAPRLMAARQVPLNPTRQLGSSLLVGLMLLCWALLCSLIASFRFYTMQDFATFRIADDGTSTGAYVETYQRDPMSPQSIRQIESLDHVRYIELERELPVYVELPQAPSYAKLNSMQTQFGMLDDKTFAISMNALGENKQWYQDNRESACGISGFQKDLRLCGRGFQDFHHHH